MFIFTSIFIFFTFFFIIYLFFYHYLFPLHVIFNFRFIFVSFSFYLHRRVHLFYHRLPIGESGGRGHRREGGGRDHLRVDGVLPLLREHAAERSHRPRKVPGEGRRDAAGQNAPVYPGLWF